MASRDTQTPEDLFRVINTKNFTLVQSYIEKGGDPNVDLTSCVPFAASGSYGDDTIVAPKGGDGLPSGHLSLLHLAVCNYYRINRVDDGAAMSLVRKLIGAGADTSVAVGNIRLCGLYSRAQPLKIRKAVTPQELAIELESYADSRGFGENVLDAVIEQLQEAAEKEARYDAYNKLASVPVHKSVPKTLKTLLFSEKFSDVKFKCQDGTTFHAHKNI